MSTNIEIDMPLTLDELQIAIETLLKNFRKEFDAQISTFHYFDEDRNILLFSVGSGVQFKDIFRWLPSGRGPAAKILRLGTPVFAEEALHHPHFTGRFTFDEGVKSGAAFPIYNVEGDSKVGIVFITCLSTIFDP